MPGSMSSVSFFRHRSARFLVGGALLGAVLFAARLPMLATVVALVSVAAVGATRRSHAEAGRPGLPGLAGQAQRPVSTSLASRQALEARLDAEWNHEHYAGQPTSLLLIGVDAYEQLHAQAEPLAGEVAMLTLASALARMLPRGADLLARYNDSTFGVILSGTDLPGSLRVAARLRWAIVRLGIANAQTASGFLTTCMGLAVHHGIDTAGTATLLAAAEGALGLAQRVGHDSLEYVVLGEENRGAASSQTSTRGSLHTQAAMPRLPAIRAWTPERAQVMHSPQS